MEILRRIMRRLAVIVITLLAAHWLTPAFQCKSPVLAIVESKKGSRNVDAAGQALSRRAASALDNLPLRFEEVRDRTNDDVKFTARAASVDFGIMPTEAVMRLHEVTDSSAGLPSAASSTSRIADLQQQAVTPSPRSASGTARKTAWLRMRLIGANPRARLAGEEQSATRINYFIGKDEKQWRRNVPNYTRVKVAQVYRGIDVVYYGSGRHLEHDFRVAPGASSRAIRFGFDGAEKVTITPAGELVVKTKLGDIRQFKPVAYQEVGGVREEVDSRYKMRAKRVVGFEMGVYDHNRPLVIDPVLVYSTLIGGSGNDSGASVAVDSAGNVYVTGKTDSTTFPITSNAFQGAKRTNGSDTDVFVTKLNSSGTGVLYSTYIGGSVEDLSHSIAVDSTGAAYLTGMTRSHDFPTTPGTVQPQGDGENAFVLKLNSDGSVAYSTFLGLSLSQGGETGITEGMGIAIDSLGNAYVTGLTSSSVFQTTPGAYQTRYGGSSGDAFITKLNPSGTALVYSTYLGGNGYEFATAIALDSGGNAYVTGFTGYSDTTFPRTEGAFQTAFGGGASDAFVTKLNSTGTALVYSTLLGGEFKGNSSGNDLGYAIAVDSAGNAYVTGATTSRDFPTTAGAFQTDFGGGLFGGDAFVTKINPKGTALVYSTFLGGTEADIGYGIALDSAGNAYVTGATQSSNYPTAGPLQQKHSSGPAFKSTDGGSTWSPINSGLACVIVNALAVDPQSSSTIYAATDTGVFKSTDGGITWNAANSGLRPSDFSSPTLSPDFSLPVLAIDPQKPSTLYLGLNSGLFKSTDSGNTWAGTPLTLAVGALMIDPTQPSTIYAGESNRVLKSTDAGNSWQPINTGLFIFARSVQTDPPSDPPPPFDVAAFAVDPANASTVYLSTVQHGAYKTTNGGASWSFIHNGIERISTRALLVDAKSTVYAGGGGGVIRSTDGGVTWTALKAGLPGIVSSLVLDPAMPARLYSGIRGNPLMGGFFKSLDGGNNWTVAGLSNVYLLALAIDPLNPSTLYAGTHSQRFLFDAFVTKLNAAGDALVYSTYFGGHSDDSGFGIAVDSAGDAYVIGESGSANLQTTPGPFQSLNRGGGSDAFVPRISSPYAITGVSIKGKKLLVRGDGFSSGAVIALNGEQQPTENDETSPTTLLVARKAGKKISAGQTVSIQVRNPDGRMSNEFTFTRKSN
jgi:photosystem II stability/assembly factor-like uncharacterized protein